MANYRNSFKSVIFVIKLSLHATGPNGFEATLMVDYYSDYRPLCGRNGFCLINGILEFCFVYFNGNCCFRYYIFYIFAVNRTRRVKYV